MHALPPWSSALACACARPFAFTREGEEGQVRLWLPFRDEEPSKKPVAQPPPDLSISVYMCVCVCVCSLPDREESNDSSSKPFPGGGILECSAWFG